MLFQTHADAMAYAFEFAAVTGYRYRVTQIFPRCWRTLRTDQVVVYGRNK